LEIEFESHETFYARVGGRIATDFVNTLAWVGTAREFDWLADGQRLRDWVSASGSDGVRANHRTAIIARTAIDEVLRPLALGDNVDATALRRLNDLVRRSCSRRTIDATTWKWTTLPSGSPASVFDFVVLDAADLLVGPEREQLRACPGCNWLFVDGSRTRKRRWCSMAACGNRSKARSHYQRQRDAL
jgi:predicted RNA-binding Zn ribbon-like protein